MSKRDYYEVLSDSNKRRMYDSHGHAAFEHGMGGGGGPGGPDMNDIFGDIFGNIFGGAGGGPRQARRGADIGYVMELDLEEAVRGVERRIEIPTLAECGDCDGSGSEDGKVETCMCAMAAARCASSAASSPCSRPATTAAAAARSSPSPARHATATAVSRKTRCCRYPAG